MSAHDRKLPSEADDELPSLEEVARRLAARPKEPLPWLTPEGLAALAEAAAQGVPEINGPETLHWPIDD